MAANAQANNTSAAGAPSFTQVQPGRGDYVWNPYSGDSPIQVENPAYMPNAPARATMEAAARTHGITDFAPPETGLSQQNVQALRAGTPAQAARIQGNAPPAQQARPVAPVKAAIPVVPQTQKQPSETILGPTNYTRTQEAIPTLGYAPNGLNFPTNEAWANKAYGQGARGATVPQTTLASSQTAAAGAKAPGMAPAQPGTSTPSMSASNASTQSASENNNAQSTSMGFDAGGVIPDGTQSAMQGNGGVQPGDLDSMYQSIQQALKFGRQKMGLLGDQGDQVAITQRPAGPGGDQPDTNPFPTKTAPNPFGKRKEVPAAPDQLSEATEDEDTQSFDNGGNVESDQSPPPLPDGQQTPQGGGGAPPQMAGYLMGAGAVDPTLASALTQRVDPRGQMDPSERVFRAVGSAGSPDQAFSLMQAYRQKFNRYRAFAATAAQGVQGKPPDMAASTKAATQAYQNLPDGTSMSFAPHGAGVAVNVKRFAGGKGAPQKGYDDGGPVDDNSSPVPDPSAFLEAPAISGDQQVSDVGSALSAAGQAITRYLTPPQYQSLLKGTPGSYDNGADVGMDKVVGSMGSPTPPPAAAQPAAGAMPGPAGMTVQAPGSPVQGGSVDARPAPPQSTVAATAPAAQPQAPIVKQGAGLPDYDPAQAGNAPAPDNTPLSKSVAEIERTAQTMFPRASQEDQRNAFVNQELNRRNEIEKARNTRLYGTKATADARIQASQQAAQSRVDVQELKNQIAQGMKQQGPMSAQWSQFGGYVKGLQNQGELTPEKIAEGRKIFGLDQLTGPAARQVGPTPRQTGADPNAAAKAWLQANPNDPRAAAVRAKLGLQ